MKYFAIVVLSIILLFVGIKVFSFWGEEQQLSNAFNDIENRLTSVKANEEILQSDVQYLANPLNLEKELRSRFNYKKQGEKMIIIVPQQSSTTSSTP